MINSKFINLSFLLLLINLSACGGGGSDSTSTTSQPTTTVTPSIFSPDHIQFSHSNYEVNRVVGYQWDPSFLVYVSLSQAAKNKIAEKGYVYFVVSHHDEENFKVTYEISDESGSFIIRAQDIDNLALGSYSDEVTVEGCYDSACTEVFGRDKFTYQVNIRPEPTVSKPTIDITHNKDNPTPPSSVDFETADYVDDWQFNIEYINAPQNWLTIEKTISNGITQINFSVDDNMACGVYTADIVFSSDALSFTKKIPVSLNLNSSSFSLLSVAPSTQFKDKPISFTLRGCGLQNYENTPLVIEGLQITGQHYRNAFELEVIAEPLTTTGEIPVTIADDTSIEAKKIAVIEPTIYEETKLDFKIDYDMSFFDHKRNILYIRHTKSSQYTWTPMHFKNGQWQLDEDFAFANVSSIDISVDGNTLAIAQNNTIKLVDATSYELLDEVIDNDLNGFHTSVEFLNNNQLLVGVYNENSPLSHTDMKLLDINNNSLTLLPVNNDFRYIIDIWSGADKSVSYAVAIGGQVMKYSPSVGRLEQIGEIDSNNYFDINQNSNRLLVKKDETFKLFDSEFTLIAQLPQFIEGNPRLEIQDATMNKNGTTAYAIYDVEKYWEYDHLSYIVEYNLTDISSELFAKQKSISQLQDWVGHQPKLKLSGNDSSLFIFSNPNTITSQILILPVEN